MNLDQLSINTIRTLAIDAVEKAKSGMPMGAAPMAYTLWTKFMNYNPSNPNWFNRDRFLGPQHRGKLLSRNMVLTKKTSWKLS